MLLKHRSEGRVDVALATSVQDMDLLFDSAGCPLHVTPPGLGIRIVGVDEHSD